VYECGALGIYVQELREGSVPRYVGPDGLDPAWSPDGSRIAFVGLTGGDYPGSLRVVNADGSGLTEVPLALSGFLILGGPAWSPDGTRIALSVCNQGCNIYVVRPDGSDLTQLTTGVHDRIWCGAVTPAWSPDGTRIAYTSVQYSECGTPWARIMEIPAEGGEPVTLVDAGWSPSWRPLR
jgi:Tol biopolymer transport system component